MMNSVGRYGFFTEGNLSFLETLSDQWAPTISAPFSRWVIENFSQNVFGLSQVAWMALAWILLEFVVHRWPELCDAEPPKDEPTPGKAGKMKRPSRLATFDRF